MNLFHRQRTAFKSIAFTVLLCFSAQCFVPVITIALTNGPTQPEFSVFEPVGSTNMVNEFTGAFTYNIPVVSIPGPNGSGYALSLSYHSGMSAEDDASWVGYGWTLNPGAITRTKRGFPDDYNGANVEYWNKIPENWTATLGAKLALEYFSMTEWVPATPTSAQQKPSADFQLSAKTVSRYNNYKGFGFTFGAGISAKGWANLGFTNTDGETSFSGSINPYKILMAMAKSANSNLDGQKNEGTVKDAEPSFEDKVLGNIGNAITSGANFQLSTNSAFGYSSFGEINRSINFAAYEGNAFNFDVGVEADFAPINIGIDGGLSGSYSYQKNNEKINKSAYGYLNLLIPDLNKTIDYYCERENPYSNRDKYLAIPFSNADLFNVSGEGLSGSFRAFQRNNGQFYPTTTESNMGIYQAGVEFHFGGATVGIGTDFGVGKQISEINKWKCTEEYNFGTNSMYSHPYFFKFINDMGSTLRYSNNINIEKSKSSIDEFINPLSRKYIIPNSINKIINQNNKIEGAGYVTANTYEDVQQRPNGDCAGTQNEGGQSYFQAYNKRKDIRDLYIVDSKGYPPSEKSVVEFATINENGQRYVFGLPVFSRNEQDMQFGVQGTDANKIKQNYLVFRNIDRNTPNAIATGEVRKEPYAASYLLTEITTPDYVDRVNDGPSDDDLGGWTKFNYIQTAGSKGKNDPSHDNWYKWRTPYRGMLYHRNSLSDANDDRGSVSFGEKEIYYLSSIETKTHIAKFILNDNQADPRLDGYEAVHNETDAMSDENATTANSNTPNKLRKLDRIELYAKKSDGTIGELISTVRFEYDYSLCQNLPNSRMINTETGFRAGKLTLKRLYFEHGGTREARISPYEFDYFYKKSSDYPGISHIEGYLPITSYADQLTDPLYENPNYSPFNTDRWGFFQRDGWDRYNQFNPWVNQKNDLLLDPAVWQLKTIKLPSGGEIHVQYEQNNYRYVQDRDAMVMISLKNESNDPNPPLWKQDNNIYYICLDCIGISEAKDGNGNYSVEVNALQDHLYDFFVTKNNRMFFKFLYSLNTAVTPSFSNCASDYISGYAQVTEVGLDPSGLYIKLAKPPKDVCQKFVRSSRNGIVMTNVCDPSTVGIPNDPDHNVGSVLDDLLANFLDGKYDADECCQQLNLPNSYVRIPVLKNKKGGGFRVKRVLMYDKGIESGTASLYGTEYFYEDKDGFSYGVATNEPSKGREENALVTFLEQRETQGTFNRIISGQDREQFEGPIGESILPSASVGYSRVVARSIHPNQTGTSLAQTSTGFTVKEFYTAKDYPFDMYYPKLGKGVDFTSISDDGPEPILLYGVFATTVQNHLYRTQGYRFILNNMHGQPKRIAAYGGNINENNSLLEDQQYNYYEPGSALLMMKDLGVKDTSSYILGTNIGYYPGMELEVIMEGRSVNDYTYDGNAEADFGISLAIFPFPWGSAMVSGNLNDESINTHVINKIIRYPAIVRSVTVTKDGVTTTTENLAFNPDNGKPVLTRIYDGYSSPRGVPLTDHEGSYYTYTFPASRYYPALGQRAESEGAIIHSKANELNIQKRYLNRHFLSFTEQQPNQIAQALSKLTPGDLIELQGFEFNTNNNTYKLESEYGTYYVGKIAGNNVELLPTYISYDNSLAKIDNVSIKIIRSAKTNQLNASVGSITTYGRWPTAADKPLQ